MIADFGNLGAAFLVTGVFAGLVYALGMASRGGALGGFVVGILTYASLGPRGFTVLALFVAGGSLLTRLGYRSKERHGTAEANGGRRGAGSAFANCGVALLCALLASLTGSGAFVVAFIAALGAAFADTAESEVGQLYSHAPRLITTFRKVPPGTNGAVSVVGTRVGLAAAVLTALLGLVLGLVTEPGIVLLITLAAFLGTVADSLIGALAPRVGHPFVRGGCLTRGVTLFWFLRRAGVDVELCFGLDPADGDGTDGHCWLVRDGQPFLERADPRPRFAEIFRLPLERA